MIVVMTHVGGPLDGTIEFDEKADAMQAETGMMLAMTTFFLTRGKVGEGVRGVSPAIADALQNTEITRPVNSHSYQIVSNEEIDGKRHVVAEYRPEKPSE